MKIEPLMKAVEAKSPVIFAGAAVLFFGTAVVLAAKSAPTAKDAYLDSKEELREDLDGSSCEEDDKAAKKDHVVRVAKTVLPCYVPSATAFVLGIACVVASNRIYLKRGDMLTAAVAMSEKALNTYEAKVLEKFGEKKVTAIEDAISEDAFNAQEPPKTAEVSDSEDGVLVFDKVTGRYFRSTIENIKRAEAEVLSKQMDEVVAYVNDLYSALGLEDVSLIGDAMGWDASRYPGDPSRKLAIRFTSMLDKDGVPVLVMYYKVSLVNQGVLS